MRTFLLLLALLIVSTGCVDDAAEPAAEVAPAEETAVAADSAGVLPAGWDARLDRADAQLEDVSFTTAGAGFAVQTGPAGIFYRPGDAASGSYTVRARITQQAPADHPEAYGLFFGGADLDGETPRYTYFLIRQTGEYLIKQRQGAETKTLAEWTASDRVATLEEGTATHELAVEVGADAVQFLVDGAQVHTVPRAEVGATDGIAGLRINHNLNVAVDQFGVER